DQVLLARVPGQALSEAAFAGADPVVRGGVEVADPGVPRGGDRAVGLLVRRLPVEVPQLGGAEAEARQRERRGGASGAHVLSSGGCGGRDQTGRMPESSPP